MRMTISGIDDNMDTSDCHKYTPKDRECVPEWTMLDILITATRTYNYFQQLIHFNKFTMEYTMVYTGENTISIHLVYS